MSASMNADKAEPNLTPILDMVFQLITFFMLVINFKAADVDQTLKLPVLGSARPVDAKGVGDLLIFNIGREGKVKVQGADLADVNGFIKKEAAASREAANRKGAKLAAGDELPTIVVVRADRETPFALVYRVVRSCQEQGFRTFNYMAHNKEPEA